MRKLVKHIESSKLMEVVIKYDNEIVKFNLLEELTINENRIIRELKEVPSAQGFIDLLVSKKSKDRDKLELKIRNERGKLFKKVKSKTDKITGRAISNELAESMVDSDGTILLLETKLINLKSEVKDLISIKDAFSTRASMLQSINANLRKES